MCQDVIHGAPVSFGEILAPAHLDLILDKLELETFIDRRFDSDFKTWLQNVPGKSGEKGEKEGRCKQRLSVLDVLEIDPHPGISFLHEVSIPSVRGAKVAQREKAIYTLGDYESLTISPSLIDSKFMGKLKKVGIRG